jgi:hypothetical protein
VPVFALLFALAIEFPSKVKYSSLSGYQFPGNWMDFTEIFLSRQEITASN